METFISIAAIIVTIILFTISLILSTKSFEIQSKYRREILHWYKETNEILIKLRIESETEFENANVKKELLAKLSANIDFGRFYFPNLEKDYGLEKTLAFQGYRNIVLDYLVFSYKLYKENDYLEHPDLGKSLHKEFTSKLYSILSPHKHIKMIKKYSKNNFYENKSYDDSNINKMNYS